MTYLQVQIILGQLHGAYAECRWPTVIITKNRRFRRRGDVDDIELCSMDPIDMMYMRLYVCVLNKRECVMVSVYVSFGCVIFVYKFSVFC